MQSKIEQCEIAEEESKEDLAINAEPKSPAGNG